jgi:hypothetical protein
MDIGLFCGTLVYFSPFWYVVPRKIWQPCSTEYLFAGQTKLEELQKIELKEMAYVHT